MELHSIRVTRVTVLLENGLPPHLVASLVGHKSVLMTLHYDSPGVEKVNSALREVQAKLSSNFVDWYISENEALHSEPDEFLNSFQESLFCSKDAKEMLHRSFEKKTPPDLFTHGICPGGQCSIGREGNGNRGESVFRPRACTFCRFRITGPAFLQGLVFRYNSLIAEFKIKASRIKGLNKEIERCELDGQTYLAQKLRLNANGLDLELDDLLKELAGEFQTIQECLGSVKSDANSLILQDQAALSVVHKELSDFTLFQNVINNAESVFGSVTEIPEGVLERRALLVRKILKTNNLMELFLYLTEEQNSEAMSKFCNLISNAHNMGTEQEHPELSNLISGKTKLNEVPGIGASMEQLFGETGFLEPTKWKISHETE